MKDEKDIWVGFAFGIAIGFIVSMMICVSIAINDKSSDHDKVYTCTEIK